LKFGIVGEKFPDPEVADSLDPTSKRNDLTWVKNNWARPITTSRVLECSMIYLKEKYSIQKLSCKVFLDSLKKNNPLVKNSRYCVTELFQCKIKNSKNNKGKILN